MAGKWLTVAETCDALGRSETTVRRYIKQGKIKSKLENGRRFVLMTPEQQQRQNDIDAAQSVLLEQLLSGVQQLDQQVTDLQDKLKRKKAQTQRQNWAAFWHRNNNHMEQSVLLEQLQSEVQHLRRQLVDLQDELKRKNAQAEREKWAAFWHG